MWEVLRYEVCVCFQGPCEVVGHARLWGRQLPFFWWISWHMQAMNYQAMGVNYPKKKGKKGNMDPAPVAPGSLFQFREWFSQNVEGKRGEAALKEWEWDDEELEKKERMNETVVYMCPPPPSPHPTLLTLFPPSFSLSLCLRSNTEGKALCENAKGYYQAFRVHECHLWWMSVGFRKASCQTLSVSPP